MLHTHFCDDMSILNVCFKKKKDFTLVSVMTWLTGYDALLVHIPGDVTACFSCGGSMGLAADGAMLMVDLQHTKKKKKQWKVTNTVRKFSYLVLDWKDLLLNCNFSHYCLVVHSINVVTFMVKLQMSHQCSHKLEANIFHACLHTVLQNLKWRLQNLPECLLQEYTST